MVITRKGCFPCIGFKPKHALSCEEGTSLVESLLAMAGNVNTRAGIESARPAQRKPIRHRFGTSLPDSRLDGFSH